MKKIPTLFAMGLAGALALGAGNARADLEVSASVSIHATADFYAPLSSCGAWVEAGSYGRCWRPAGVVVGWRPYCSGYWVWTDCGWYWVSDEPWAWACYHYGWWVYDSTYGWVWVPGVKWAPAWVCWRIGGGYIGWAPLPPQGHFFAHRAADSAFVFVNADHFNDHIRASGVIVNNNTILERTKYIADVKPVTRNFAGFGSRKVNVNEGPGLAAIEKASGKTFKPLPVRDAIDRTPLPPHFGSKPGQPEIKNDQHSPKFLDNHPATLDQGKARVSEQPTRERSNSDHPSGKGSDQSRENDHDNDNDHGHDHGHD